MTYVDELATLLARLPGIGRKNAVKLVYFLLKNDKKFASALGEKIMDLQECVGRCPICGYYGEASGCDVCADESRDRSTLCVVEEPEDAMNIEATKSYTGLYHVLGGTIAPLDGVGPDDLFIDALLVRLSDGSVKEVILATNLSVEGDVTARYVKGLLNDNDALKISRIAGGLPVGGNLEYADPLTLTRSLLGRGSFT